MDSLINEITRIAGNYDHAAKSALAVTLRDLAYSLETPDNTLQRLGTLHLETASARIGFDLNLFRTLSEHGKPVKTEELARTLQVEPHFLARLLRHLAATGMIKEVGENEFQATNVTRNLATPLVESGVSHFFETVSPLYQALPEYMANADHKSPSDPMHTVFQAARNEKRSQYEWFSDHPKDLRLYNEFMANRRETSRSYMAVYPFEDELQKADPSADVYVDMGGGIGHQCAQFIEEFPQYKDRVILQELPHTISEAVPILGVQFMAHDLHDPQPVKGAKFYYMRAVLHSQPDEKARKIISNVLSAMGPESKLLVDELVLPNTGVSVFGAAIDLTMMSAFGAQERTEAQWRTLFESAGMKLQRKFVYNPSFYETVMEVVRMPTSPNTTDMST